MRLKDKVAIVLLPSERSSWCQWNVPTGPAP